jgi:hydrogenase expression/formation protein HypC
MCLAIPARITRVDPDTQTGEVDLAGVTKEISLALVSDAAVGDYVLVHVGYALNKLSQDEAEQTLRLIEEMGRLMDEEPWTASQAGPA